MTMVAKRLHTDPSNPGRYGLTINIRPAFFKEQNANFIQFGYWRRIIYVLRVQGGTAKMMIKIGLFLCAMIVLLASAFIGHNQGGKNNAKRN